MGYSIQISASILRPRGALFHAIHRGRKGCSISPRKLDVKLTFHFTVSGMAKWLRCSLAEWKVPGLNLTMGKVSEKVLEKKRKKKASYPLLA